MNARAELLRDQVKKTWAPPLRGMGSPADIAQTAVMQTLAFVIGIEFLLELTAAQEDAIRQGLRLLESVLGSESPPEVPVPTEALLKAYRAARSQLLARVEQEFPAGSRVQPIGTTTGNWGATIRELAEVDRVRISADMVFLDWDNGNRFASPIDAIERF